MTTPPTAPPSTTPSTTPSPPPATVLGLGDMGHALAEALLRDGHPTTVWNRSPGRADELVAQGAVRAATPGEAIAASPLVIACLLDHASVHGVLDPVAGGLAGRTLVNLTTGTPDQGRELAGWAVEHDVDGFLDGGIMAVPSMIGGPEASILYSGSESAFETHAGTLEKFGAARYVGVDAGRAALLDLAMLHGMYGTIVGFLQAAAIVDVEGVELSEFTDTLLMPWLNGMLGVLPEYARQIETGDYTANGSNLAMQAAGMTFDEFNESLGIRGGLLGPLGRLMRQRVEDGHGTDDVSGVFELIRSTGTEQASDGREERSMKGDDGR